MARPSRETLFTAFFFLLFFFVLFQAWRLLAPFMASVVLAIVVGVVLFPVHRWLGRWIGRYPSVHALVTDTGVFLFLVIPVVLIIWALVAEVAQIVPQVRGGVERAVAWVQASPSDSTLLRRLPESIRQQFDVRRSQVQERVAQIARQAASQAARIGTATAMSTIEFFFGLFLFLFTLFFVFRDGPGWYAQWNELLPLSRENRDRLHDRIEATFIGVVRGTFLTALAQAVVAGIGFLVVRAEAALLLACLSFIATLIPSVGTALVWVPVALYYFITGVLWKGIVMTVWGVVFIGLTDNILRPFVVGAKAEMPFFWLFMSILGGLSVFGAMGLILGPLIMSLVPILLDIFRSQFLHRPPAPE